jgi:putative endonuclease
MTASTWHVYILDCDHRFYYTGITTDVNRRLAEHREGRMPGAKATRGTKQIELMYSKAVGSRSEAQRVEYRIKQLAREDKARIVAKQPPIDRLLEMLGIG